MRQCKQTKQEGGKKKDRKEGSHTKKTTFEKSVHGGLKSKGKEQKREPRQNPGKRKKVTKKAEKALPHRGRFSSKNKGMRGKPREKKEHPS